jgi:hypothetical protein
MLNKSCGVFVMTDQVQVTTHSTKAQGQSALPCPPVRSILRDFFIDVGDMNEA